MRFLTYYVTFSRAGAPWPYQTVYQRAAGEYKPGELAVLGGQLEILPGNLCGSGNLKLSAVPERGGSRMAPGDWVRVYLSDSDTPIYLGEVGQEPWETGAGEVKLLSLKDRVSSAAWRSDVDTDGKTVLPLKARFRPYLQAVLARAVLPPGITVGSIADVNAVLNALTLFELVGDAMQAALPAAAGATWGVNALGEIVVHQLTDTLTHRFPRARSDRPPGVRDGYKNCVRFEYARPDTVRAFFEYKATLEIAVFGEAWLQEGLPASVTTTQNNPYSGTSVDVIVLLDHPDNPTLTASVYGLQTALTPAWTGHLGDGLTLNPAVTQGAAYQPVASGGEGGNITAATGTAFSYDVLLSVPVSGLTIEYKIGAGSWTPSTEPYGASSFVRFTTSSAQALEWRYLQDSAYDAYRTAHSGDRPPAFSVNIATAVPADYARLTVSLPGVSAAQPSFRALFKARRIPTDPAGSYLQFVIAPFTVNRTRVGLPGVYVWRSGDTVSTDVNVSAVTLANPTLTSPVSIMLTRKDDVDGRRIWSTPQDITASEMVITGPPASVGWIGAAIADQFALVAYAYGLLRYKMQPVRSWVGKYKTLRRLDVSGIARFDTANGDVDLDVTRGVYDLDTLTPSIEAGTPQPLDDTEALDLGFQSVERILRTPGGGA
ncbi:hypothetical protein FNU79_16230 [Deinococcus detaillensis]|uniref:Uncharacterized protein n=1 Tax=Deinococcus detaillensis TaxID=2592048 RepID=A0A553UKR7_9DEIO|nr:hypothetical protein [Deinococcus detaillensis]TSA80790.1 hypothetical protein FNU79_16230 [Deinococcus detaillensis]